MPAKKTKLVLKIVSFLVLLSFFIVPIVQAADSASVTATVTAQNVSVTVSDGSISYGTLAVNNTEDTTSSGVDDSQTATNNGNVDEDFAANQ